MAEIQTTREAISELLPLICKTES